jgi:hypothetical protein
LIGLAEAMNVILAMHEELSVCRAEIKIYKRQLENQWPQQLQGQQQELFYSLHDKPSHIS